MSLNDSVQRSFILTEGQNRRLKHFCKFHKITASQWLRLQIDELRISEYDSLRDSIERDSFKVQNFLGVFDHEEPIREVISDENGNKQARWFKKSMPWYK